MSGLDREVPTEGEEEDSLQPRSLWHRVLIQGLRCRIVAGVAELLATNEDGLLAGLSFEMWMTPPDTLGGQG